MSAKKQRNNSGAAVATQPVLDVAAIRRSGVPMSKAELMSLQGTSSFMKREQFFQEEEAKRQFYIYHAHNDGTQVNNIFLTASKMIFSRQLPKMPRDYIFRVVFDRKHDTLCVVRHMTVIGAVCFRIFKSQNFAEIVFFAVANQEQVKGVGSRLMCHLKEFVKKRGVYNFLTYADNFAINFFRKNNFTLQIRMPKHKWVGFVKDYEGGTFVHCQINPNMNYLRIHNTVAEQRKAIYKALRDLSASHIVYDGTSEFTSGGEGTVVSVDEIRGLRKAGYVAAPTPPLETLHAHFRAVMDAVREHKDAWPFAEPVSRKDVPDYYDVIKDPIDITVIDKRVALGTFYRTKNIFYADLKRMFSNCRLYNNKDTPYYKCADNCEATLKELWPEYAVM